MKIGIIGTGGVGGYFGARLASSGNEVTFIARGKHLQAIQKNGLVVKSVKGDVTIKPGHVSEKISDLAGCELVILGTKAYQIKEIAPILAQSLNKEALILPLQNGVLAVDELSAHFDKKQILGGLCLIFSHIESFGVINHMGLEPTITFGEPDQTIKERTRAIKELFDRAEINNNLTDDVESAIWRKFILICLSGLGTILNTGYGLIRATPETRKIMVEVLTEVSRIARAKHIHLEKDIVEKSMAFVDSYPPESMSSLSRDVLNGKPSEIDYQNGTVVRFGEELGIDTPANRFILGMVKLLEQKYKTQKA